MTVIALHWHISLSVKLHQCKVGSPCVAVCFLDGGAATYIPITISCGKAALGRIQAKQQAHTSTRHGWLSKEWHEGPLHDSVPARFISGEGNQEQRPGHVLSTGLSMGSAANALRAWGHYKGKGKGQWPTGKTGLATRDATTNREIGKEKPESQRQWEGRDWGGPQSAKHHGGDPLFQPR